MGGLYHKRPHGSHNTPETALKCYTELLEADSTSLIECTLRSHKIAVSWYTDELVRSTTRFTNSRGILMLSTPTSKES